MDCVASNESKLFPHSAISIPTVDITQVFLSIRWQLGGTLSQHNVFPQYTAVYIGRYEPLVLPKDVTCLTILAAVAAPTSI
jgi:hypothetical protein